MVSCALVAIPVGLGAGRVAWDRYAVALGVDAGAVSIPSGVVAVVGIVFSLSQIAVATTSCHVTTNAEKVREQEFTLAASR